MPESRQAPAPVDVLWFEPVSRRLLKNLHDVVHGILAPLNTPKHSAGVLCKRLGGEEECSSGKCR